jgi:hypothetical protein
MSEEEHKKRHEELHSALDELLADYITCTHKSLSGSTIMDLLKWSYKQTQKPESEK